MGKGQTTKGAICCGGLDMAGRPAVVEVRGAYTRIRPLELSRRACLDSLRGQEARAALRRSPPPSPPSPTPIRPSLPFCLHPSAAPMTAWTDPTNASY